MARKSGTLSIQKKPSVPSGGRMNPTMDQKTMPKVPLPAKGKSSKESSTRMPGPK
jgi:hypothetical protein